MLSEEKINVETTLKSDVTVKNRLVEFQKLLTSNKLLTEFDRTFFESVVEKIIVGGINSEGEIDPAMLTIIFKTGDKQCKNGKQFKRRRKNAKQKLDKLCSQNRDEYEKMCLQETVDTRRVCCSARKSLETFERKHLKKPWRQGFLACGGVVSE